MQHVEGVKWNNVLRMYSALTHICKFWLGCWAQSGFASPALPFQAQEETWPCRDSSRLTSRSNRLGKQEIAVLENAMFILKSHLHESPPPPPPHHHLHLNPPFVIWFSYLSSSLIFVPFLIVDTSDGIVTAAHFLLPRERCRKPDLKGEVRTLMTALASKSNSNFAEEIKLSELTLPLNRLRARCSTTWN